MSSPHFLSDLLVPVLLNIRKFRTLRRERRYKVSHSNVCIWDRASKRVLVGIMPVSTGRIVSFKYMNVIAFLKELPISNEATISLNERLRYVRIAYDVPWSCANNGNFVDGPFKLIIA